MAFALGTNAFLGVGKETTWGQAVDPDWYIDFLLAGETLSLNREYDFLPRLDGTSQRKEPYLKRQLVTGELPIQLNYEGIELFLYQLLGSVTGPTLVGASSAYQWIFKPGNSLPAGLTLHMNRDVKKWKYAGCKLSAGKFEFSSGEAGKATFTVLGKSLTTDTADNRSTVDFKTFKPVMQTHGTVEIDDTDRSSSLKSATVNIENPLSEEQPICDADGYIIEPQFTDKMKVSGTLVGWMSTTMYSAVSAKFEAGTAAKVELIYTGEEIEAGYDYTFKITLPNIYLVGAGDPTVAAAGLLEVTWNFEAWYDGTDDQIEIELINTNGTSL